MRAKNQSAGFRPSITKFSLIVASRYRLRECTTPLAIRLLAPTRCYTHIVAMSDSGEPNRLNRFLTAVLARFQAAQTPWFPCTKKHKATGPTFFRSRRTSGERCHPRRLAHRGLLLQPRANLPLKRKPRAAGSTPKAVPAEGDPEIRVSY